MTGDLIPANVLATHTIANVSETLAEKLGLPQPVSYTHLTLPTN